MITKLPLRVFVFFNILVISVVGNNCVTLDVSVELTNKRHSRSLKAEYKLLSPNSTILIPLQGKDAAVVRDAEETKKKKKKKKKRRKCMIGMYTSVGLVGFVGVGLLAFLLIHWRQRKRKNGGDVEQQQQQQQQLSLSIRTTSENKVSFEGSQYNFDEHKTRVESYAFEDLQKATQDFSLGNLIQGSVFHGRLKGKNMAIKRVATQAIVIDTEIFQDRIHHCPNIIRLLGTCMMDGPDSFLVLEYAKNGSLKDWIHGGLAIKSHFIASCSCFLSWNQRLKICVDVATALQHMHHVMNPSYVHRKIKSRNIFLDEDFNAKLGMGKLSDDAVSPSTDIFAYGIVLLEVLSGKHATNDGDEIKQIVQSEDAEELRGWMDSTLGESYSFDGAVTLANLARSCVEQDPSSRPNAGEIVEKLLRLVEELPPGDRSSL